MSLSTGKGLELSFEFQSAESYAGIGGWERMKELGRERGRGLVL